MGVRIGGVWHEELPDPGTGGSDSGNGRNYSSMGDYQASGGSPSSGSGPAPTSSTQSGGGGGGGQGANLGAAQLLLNQAQQAAYQAYLTARLNLDTDTQAFTKAQQAFTNKITEASLTGTYNGQQTQAAQQQQFSQGLATEQEQNKTALGYLQQIGQLRGPQDYGQYLRVLGSTPNGLRDLVSGAMGNYRLGGGTTGVAPVPVTLGGVAADVAGTSGGTNYAQFQAAAQGLPAPNQIAPQAYNAMSPTQHQLLGSLYESQGWRPEDVQDLYQKSLPRYGYSGVGTVAR